MSSVLEKEGVELSGKMEPGFDAILTPEALRFVAKLHRTFNARRLQLLKDRETRQAKLDAGQRPDFLKETADIRKKDWTVAPIPKDLLDRRVEITGPVDRKMTINALNSGARVFMADFEDSHSPTWTGTVEGQINMRDAVRRTITFTKGDGKKYELKDKIAVLMVRPRGWHLPERHVKIDGEETSGSLFDFGLYFFHNAKELLERGSGPYFYLPKLESHLEARLWNDVFTFAQKELGVPHGSIRATVLIETILAAFEMDEILWELKDHSAGLNCGRWDYIFSVIKKFAASPDFVLPDRAEVGMTVHFMRSYSKLLIKTCHRRGIHAMGGMAAQIPIKNDDAANEAALAKVRADKEREVGDGHDGTWVAHPGLVALATEIFDKGMPEPNQIAAKHAEYSISADDLLKMPAGHRTEQGLRWNLRVGVEYLAAWLCGNGCVPLYNLMEDAATSEISRAQVWQWIRHRAELDDGKRVDAALAETLLKEELESIREAVGPERFGAGRYELAADIFRKLLSAEAFPSFLTLPAYEHLD